MVDEVKKNASSQPGLGSRKLEDLLPANWGDTLLWARWLDRAALFILLLVVASRPLVSETYESAQRMLERAAEAGDSLTPAATVWFDMAIWVAAIAAATALALRRWEWRWSGIELGWVLMAAGAVISTWAASNRRIALNASCDWLTAMVMLMVLANLARDRFRVTLLLSVIAATGLVSLTKCGMQTFIEHGETQYHYQVNREEFWERQGVALDDPTVELFEARMRAREASGFLPFSNAQGSLLSLAGFAALALRGVRVRTQWPQTMLLMLACLVMLGTLLTGSKAAAIGVAVGMLLWRLLHGQHIQLRPRWRQVWIAAWVLIAVGVVAVVGFGMRRGGLPHDSLNFRWQYWQLTADIIRENLLTGVGAYNFDRHYMLHKPVEYPEEIRDPHNFALSIWAQWGLAGGLGMLAALLGASLLLVRMWGRHTPEDEPAAVEEHVALERGKYWVLALAAAFLCVRFLLLYSPGNSSIEHRALLWFDLGFYGLVWVTALIAFQWIGTLGRNAEVDYYRMPILCGVLVFLLHNLVEFSLFVPGTLTLLAAAGGVLIARAPRARAPESSPYGPMLMPAAGAFAALALGISTFIPVSRSSAAMADARRAEHRAAAIAGFEEAARADSWDPTPWAEAAVVQVQDPRLASLNTAVTFMDRALERDPEDSTLHQLKVAILLLRYEAGQSTSDLLGAVESARRCVAMYPASPERLADLGSVLEKLAAETGDDALRLEAVECYRNALKLNATRPFIEIRRWSDERVASIESHAAMLATAPAPLPETSVSPE